MRIKCFIWIIGMIMFIGIVNSFSYQPVLNLTFDNQTNWTKDYAMGHYFNVIGSASNSQSSLCKWYGCANFSNNTRGMSTNLIDRINSSVLWSSTNGMACKWWENHIGNSISGSNSRAEFNIGKSTNTSRNVQHQGYGIKATWSASSGLVTQNDGSSYEVSPNVWYMYFVQYNPTTERLLIYRNSVLTSNSSEPYGNLNNSIGDTISIGSGSPINQIDWQGYIDEFVCWNVSNFTSEDIYAFYNEQLLGTPPTTDLYVKNITYTLPFNFSSINKSLPSNYNLYVNFTIENAGVNVTNLFAYNFTIEGANVCSGYTELEGMGKTQINCTLNVNYGYFKGNMTLDLYNNVSEGIETNNVQKVYIPYLNLPYIHYNLSEARDILMPYAQNSNNQVAYDDWSWAKTEGCSAFSESYTGNNVDPYGKFARICAINCFNANYTEPDAPSKVQCQRAKTHLLGWANRSITTYDNVQSIHELVQVGIAFQLMMPNLTETEFNYLSSRYEQICQQITNLPSTRPDLDNDDIITGGNGYGFGSGMGGFCYSIIGLNPDNPTLIQRYPQQYWGSNIPDEWMGREESFLRSYKNDSWSKYQEGWNYKWYATYHLVENWWFEKKFGLRANYLDKYQPALCSMARELITDVTDFNYLGKTIRNDRTQKMRGVQRGDSYSYAHPADGNSAIGFAVETYFGLLCDDINTKKGVLFVRNLTNYAGDDSLSYLDEFLYGQLYYQVNDIPKSIDNITPKVVYDNANDILTIRTNYTYTNDTIIQIDGGEERGSGHSQAQGYYIYAFGEPFLDYTQVPYEDDVRAETWKNGISLQNITQNIEGLNGEYSEDCGNAPKNQYYGMSNCGSVYYSEDGTDYRAFPLQYGGDIEDYLGTQDGHFGVAYVWRPYKNADNVQEYFIKFGNMLIKRTKVTGNIESQGIFENFVNLQNETNKIINSLNTTITPTRNQQAHLEVNFIWGNTTFTLGGGNTTINACRGKTSCSGADRINSTYWRQYLHSRTNDTDFIISHEMYYGAKTCVSGLIQGTDKGEYCGNNNIIFDTDNNGYVNYSNKNATGWGLAFNDATKEYAAFNSTFFYNGSNYLWTANESMEVHMQANSGQIIMTINNMQRRIGIDYPRQTTLTVNTTFLTNSSGISTKSTTFNVTGAQIPVVYTITANSSDYLVRDMTGALLGAGEAGKEETPVATVTRGITFGTGSGIRFGNGGRMIW